MQRVKPKRRLAPHPAAGKEDALRRGINDGLEWAEHRAHPSELSLIGLPYEISKSSGWKIDFRDRGARPSHEQFLLLIKPSLHDEDIQAEAENLWGSRLETIKGFGRFSHHYLKAFADAALSVWLTIRESWEAVAYVRGVEAGRLWASTAAKSEELERLRLENQGHARWHGGRIYFPDIDDPLKIAEIILPPEPCDDDDEWDEDADNLFTMRFWGPILGGAIGTNIHRIREPRFVLGFVAGALGKEQELWRKF